MEELIILVIQFIVELFVGGVLYLPCDWSLYSEEESGGCGLVLLYLVLGGALGGLSILMAPHLLLPDTTYRILNLAFAPLATGLLGWSIATLLRKKSIRSSVHFWYGFSFALAFSGVRLAYASR